MEILNLTTRKRETYQVQIKYSVLWECALGIAAITNTPIIGTLDKPVEYWRDLRGNLTKRLLDDLDFVEKENTWKALLQLLHQEDFTDLKEFTSFIQERSIETLKLICLPFVGKKYEETRRKSSLGEELAIKEMKKVTSNNPFFPNYIEFICRANEKHLKEHLISVMTGWYKEVIERDVKQLHNFLQTDYEMKNNQKDTLTPEELVEWATGGITYLAEPSVHDVLLIPQYVYRPWNIEADLEGTKVFYYPIANESIAPNDRYTPRNSLVLKHKALGDEVRLRIVKLLNEQDRSLQDITEQINIGKSTIHHHLKILRAAKLVEIIATKYSLKRNALDLLSKELDLYLKQ